MAQAAPRVLESTSTTPTEATIETSVSIPLQVARIRDEFAETLNQVANSGERVVIERHGKRT